MTLCLLCLFVALLNAVGAALPEDEDLAVQLIGNGLDRRLIGNQGAVLFGVTRDADRAAREVVSSVDPHAALLAEMPSGNRRRIAVVPVFILCGGGGAKSPRASGFLSAVAFESPTVGWGWSSACRVSLSLFAIFCFDFGRLCALLGGWLVSEFTLSRV